MYLERTYAQTRSTSLSSGYCVDMSVPRGLSSGTPT
uniref:Uncharacterized protein n=1 Tax=Zea mays TaxID=4577 RepID=C4J1C2_MAIZE|nr:unknown [Zea mays]